MFEVKNLHRRQLTACTCGKVLAKAFGPFIAYEVDLVLVRDDHVPSGVVYDNSTLQRHARPRTLVTLDEPVCPVSLLFLALRTISLALAQPLAYRSIQPIIIEARKVIAA